MPRVWKHIVRILKRSENDLVDSGQIEALPSYFMECLMYQVPDHYFFSASSAPLTDVLANALAYIWSATKPGGAANAWLEPNGIKPLFGQGQPWTIDQAHTLAMAVFGMYELGVAA